MSRRRFRYDKESDSMVEIPLHDDFVPGVSIHGDIEPFLSPVNGEVIRSRSHMEDHMARHGIRHKEAGSNVRSSDRYEQGRTDKALREQLYERVDRMMQQPATRKYLRDRR